MNKAGVVGLELLEQKINKAATIIERLKQEKIQIEEENKTLKEKIDSLYIEKGELEQKIEVLNEAKAVSRDSEKSREEIKIKIEEMLAKLESIDI